MSSITQTLRHRHDAVDVHVNVLKNNGEELVELCYFKWKLGCGFLSHPHVPGLEIICFFFLQRLSEPYYIIVEKHGVLLFGIISNYRKRWF